MYGTARPSSPSSAAGLKWNPVSALPTKGPPSDGPDDLSFSEKVITGTLWAGADVGAADVSGVSRLARTRGIGVPASASRATPSALTQDASSLAAIWRAFERS